MTGDTLGKALASVSSSFVTLLKRVLSILSYCLAHSKAVRPTNTSVGLISSLCPFIID